MRRAILARDTLKTVPRHHTAIAVLAAVLFAWIAFVALQPQPPAFDIEVRDGVHHMASSPLTSSMKFITRLGEGWFLWPVGILIVLGLLLANRRHEAAVFGITVIGANILDESLKLLFHRPRPEPFFNHPKPASYSFPSGHAFVSFCFYIALAEILIDPDWGHSRRLSVGILAILLVLAIGFSRVYLGVHYPTDVLAGYAGAIAWTGLVRSMQPRLR
jgi:undecaprenyl-diphosphatase